MITLHGVMRQCLRFVSKMQDEDEQDKMVKTKRKSCKNESEKNRDYENQKRRKGKKGQRRRGDEEKKRGGEEEERRKGRKEERRRKGEKEKRRKGEKEKRRKGEKEKRRKGEKEKRRKGEKEKRRKGDKEERRKGEKEKRITGIRVRKRRRGGIKKAKNEDEDGYVARRGRSTTECMPSCEGVCSSVAKLLRFFRMIILLFCLICYLGRNICENNCGRP